MAEHSVLERVAEHSVNEYFAKHSVLQHSVWIFLASITIAWVFEIGARRELWEVKFNFRVCWGGITVCQILETGRVPRF